MCEIIWQTSTRKMERVIICSIRRKFPLLFTINVFRYIFLLLALQYNLAPQKNTSFSENHFVMRAGCQESSPETEAQRMSLLSQVFKSFLTPLSQYSSWNVLGNQAPAILFTLFYSSLISLFMHRNILHKGMSLPQKHQIGMFHTWMPS